MPFCRAIGVSRGQIRSHRRLAWLIVVILFPLIPQHLSAQGKLDEGQSGFEPHMTMLPGRNPRSADELKSFIDTLSATDAMFEVIVGQGRLITLREDIAAPDKPEPIVATGDPTVVDFEIIGARHIRVTGRRIGATDLSIVTGDRNNYTFEIQVVADLDILRARLRQTFPDASLKVAQIRDHVIIEGQARDSRQVAKIVEMVKAYLNCFIHSET
ncbi:MAG: pilus assembly protein N-terminal domain-containing protein, partial [Planctomycetaceae bacterium]